MTSASGRMSNAARWSLAQALAWVLSRDIAFVESLAPDRNQPITYTHLVAQVRNAGFSVSFREAERELIDCIANDEMIAEGEPGLTPEGREDRQVIGARARWAQIEDGCCESSEGWLLEPQGEHQSRWYGVEIDANALRQCFPDPKAEVVRRAGGRPDKYDWARIRTHVFSQLDHHGMPSCIDTEWANNADVEKSALEFCRQTFDQGPAASTMRRKISEWVREYEISARN